jgi:sigma-B regulation protein RsbU (phosphoserine phosphatase)
MHVFHRYCDDKEGGRTLLRCVYEEHIDEVRASLTVTEDKNTLRLLAFRTPASQQERSLFLPHYDIFWELAVGEALPEILPPLSHKPYRDKSFVLSLRTDTCYRLPIAAMVTKHIAQKLLLGAIAKSQLQTALQEGLTNAMIHGNLEIHQRFHQYQDFQVYCDHVIERLNDPVLAARRIDLFVCWQGDALEICLSHVGEPFQPSLLQDDSTYQGRGMAVMQACGAHVKFEEGKKDLCLRFNLEAFAATRVANKKDIPYLKAFQKALSQAKILLVDDQDFNLFVLQEILALHNLHNVSIAKNGQDALEKTLTEQPDLVIIDMSMPIMDGYAYCTQLRQLPSFTPLPVLALTAQTDPEQRLLALQAGATDLFSKPIYPEEFFERVSMHLEKTVLLKSLEEYRKEVEADFEIARDMQVVLMPSETKLTQIAVEHHIEISAHFEPSRNIGGDFWHVYTLDDHRIACIMIDFAGHGLSAALNVFRLHALLQDMPLQDYTAGEFLTVLNAKLYSLLSAAQFATAFYGIIDTQTDMLEYAVAATPTPLVFTPAQQHYTHLRGVGVPLGVDSDSVYQTQHVPFRKGDSLLLYSDALIETPNQQGIMIKPQDIEIAFRNIPPHNIPKVYFATLLALFSAHTINELTDDLTLTLYSRV